MKKGFCIVMVLLLASVSLIFAGADKEQSEDTSTGAAAVSTGKYSEAPMLAERVARGELPPVEDRLPLEPFVVGPGVLISLRDLPDWQVGKYGGTLTSTHVTPDDRSVDIEQGNFDHLLTVPGGGDIWEGLKGSLLLDFEVSDDSRVFTFWMREGMKWSDGAPVTSEDVRFAIEDVIFNETITPTVPASYRAGNSGDGEPMKLEILGPYQFKVEFAEPYGVFLSKLTIRWQLGIQGMIKPKHYLKQFHIDYTPLEDMKPMLEEQGFGDEWWKLFQLKDITLWHTTSTRAMGVPTLNPWLKIEAPEDIVLMERNPYYWKVDIEGNQLPYIDRLQSTYCANIEAEVLKVIAGETDFLRENAGLKDLTVFRENENRGNYEARVYFPGWYAPTVVIINQLHEDQVWNQVAGDVRFRRALSVGMNRDEIIENVYQGLVTKPIWVPSEFDPEEANRLLDEVGLDKRDSNGLRLGPDGKPFIVLFEVAQLMTGLIPATEIVVEQYRELGLNVQMKQYSPELLGQRRGANETKVTVGWLHPAMWAEGIQNYFPWTWGINAQWERYWLTNGRDGIEPPEWAKGIFDLHKRAMQNRPDSEGMIQVEAEIRDWYYENIPHVMMVTEIGDVMIVRKGLKNVGTSGWSISSYMEMEQYYFD